MGTTRRLLAITGLLASLLAAAPAGALAGPVPQRFSGADRYATAAALSASRFEPGVPVVHVVTGAGFADALVAGVAAGLAGGPVLLTGRSSVPSATAAELDRLSPGSIVVVGGTGAVSDAVLRTLRTHTDGEVTRVHGGHRYETAAEVSARTFEAADQVFVASGERFADALSGVPAAVRGSAPLLLTSKWTLPATTAEELGRLGPSSITILGGEGAVSASVQAELGRYAGTVGRVAGENRYATSAALADRTFPAGAPVAYLATGSAFADALAAGPVAALAGGPVLLVRANCIPGRVLDELGGQARLVLVGGDRAVGRGVEDRSRCPYASAPTVAPSVSPTPAPAWDDDGPDPHIVRFGDRWYAYTTGTTWGNNIGVLVSDRPDGGWRTTTGKTYGSSAMDGQIPDWQVHDTQWSPAVYRFAGRYVMFYAARSKARGEWCLSVATATAPAGPFHDGSAGPTICQDHLGGVIDPHPFVDADGTPWLHFKNNDGMDNNGFGNDVVSHVLVTRLAADGVTPVGGFGTVLTKDTSRHPWQTTVDNPQMVLRGGVHYLFHTGGNYVGDGSYATGYAVCAGPTGPCETKGKLLQSYGDVAGPGGGTVAVDLAGDWWMSYHAWTKGCYDYEACGGKRKLYVAPLNF